MAGWDGKLIDRAREDAAGAFEELSTPPLPDVARLAHRLPQCGRPAEDCVQKTAIPIRERLQNLKPEHLLPSVVPWLRTETVQDSAAWSLREASEQSMVDELEADLIRRVLLGDREAYEGIVTPHLAIAWRLAYHQLRDHSLAEDCVWMAADRAWQRLKNLKPGFPFRPWFLGIVVRQCQEIRRSRWMTAVILVDPGLIRSNDDGWLEHDREGAELRRAFASLRRNDQVAIYLHFVEDIPQAQVAETLGISLSNVKSRINRLRRWASACRMSSRGSTGPRSGCAWRWTRR